MPLARMIDRFCTAMIVAAIPGLAAAQYSPEATAVMLRLRSDPRVPFALQAIREGYYPTPDLNSAANRCIVAASLIPIAPIPLQTEACLRAMIGGLDPFSAYLSAQEVKLLTMQPAKAGIGLEIRKAERGAEIVSLMEDSPGIPAGLGIGTLIVAIDDKPTLAMSLPEVAFALRGAEGSIASLDVILPESPETTRIEVKRKYIRQAGITTQMIDGHLGYVRIQQFGSTLAQELAEALHSLLILPLRPAKGLIIDLRDCTGGLLHGAIALAAVFLPEDKTVLLLSSRREGERLYRARLQDASSKNFDPSPLLDNQTLRNAAQKIPLLILVNHGTASGAEAAVAALQESGRAYVIGQPTAGISSVQTLLPMKNQDAIKLTTEVMHTASGKTWAEQGIRPDFPVDQALAVRRGVPITDDPWLKFAVEHFAKH